MVRQNISGLVNNAGDDSRGLRVNTDETTTTIGPDGKLKVIGVSSGGSSAVALGEDALMADRNAAAPTAGGYSYLSGYGGVGWEGTVQDNSALPSWYVLADGSAPPVYALTIPQDGLYQVSLVAPVFNGIEVHDQSADLVLAINATIGTDGVVSTPGTIIKPRATARTQPDSPDTVWYDYAYTQWAVCWVTIHALIPLHAADTLSLLIGQTFGALVPGHVGANRPMDVSLYESTSLIFRVDGLT